MAAPIPPKFQLPKFRRYDGTTNPVFHVDNFQGVVSLIPISDALKCRAFVSTLDDVALQWFKGLPPRTIGTFTELAQRFVDHFFSTVQYSRCTDDLCRVMQEDGELFRDFAQRYQAEVMKVLDLDIRTAVNILTRVCSNEPFVASIAKKPPASLADLLARMQKYVRLESTLGAAGRLKRSASGGGSALPPARKPKKEEGGRKENTRSSVWDRLGEQQLPRFGRRPSEILQVIKKLPGYRKPAPIKSSGPRDQSRYCEYHKDVGHTTDQCRVLRAEITDLLKRGVIGKDVVDGKPREPEPKGDDRRAPEKGEVLVLHGGPAGGGDSSRKRKAYAASVQIVARPGGGNVLTFSDADLEGLRLPHDDALVIRATIDGYDVHRILVDNGAAPDVLFYDCYLKMPHLSADLTPVVTPLFGFAGAPVATEGSIKLMVTVGVEPHITTVEVNFLVVKVRSAYNAIFGRGLLGKLGGVPSSYHQKLKFPTSHGVGEVRGDQSEARKCYVNAIKAKEPESSNYSPLSPPVDEANRGEAAEKTMEVLIDDHRKVTIGCDLREHEPDVVSLLKESADVFAWSEAELPGIDPEVIQHRLNVDPATKPVQQKIRSLSADRREVVDESLGKYLDAGTAREVNYPAWVANVVLVKKANGKWRMCVDFTDLNKACPKDSYPLPRIDQLVDSTAGHELLSFLDAYSGYHQIRMAPEDEEKTAFTTHRGLYCFTRMPFGLKNAGATYQRLVNKMFEQQIGKTIEIYVDDMLVKSRLAEDHSRDLRDVFNVLRRYGMKLNPEKCVFGARAGKFLGYLVSSRGIDVNPDKVNAILEMTAPRTIKEIQRLNGRIAALSRFMARSAERCKPFFDTLRKHGRFEWTEDCQKAFDDLKGYLSQVPTLSTPCAGEELLLYLSVTEHSVSSVLAREKDRQHLPVYYASKALRGPETRYSDMERVALALVVAARRLRPYFLAHRTVVLTDLPLRQVLGRPEASGRLAKWAIELSEFDIAYRPRVAIKAQALADFISEGTARPGPASEIPEAEGHWEVYVDGASSSHGSGTGVVLRSPDGTILKYAIRLGFPSSNNVAEYEAVISGLRMAKSLGASRVRIYSDSQLVVNQVSGEYETREEKLVPYAAKVKLLLAGFESAELSKIPRSDNMQADALSKLAATLNQLPGSTVLIEELAGPSVEPPAEVLCTQTGETWMTPLVRHLSGGGLPEAPEEAQKIERQARRFFLLDDELYRKGFSYPHLKCVGPRQAVEILEEIHEGSCGSHTGARSLARRTTRQGYWWPTLLKDAENYVRRCKQCQAFARLTHQPPSELTTIAAPWPFAKWGIDILGPFPLASGQRKFLIVAVDYFTKWVEASPLAKITDAKAWEFVWQNIVCRFGVPHTLISDNGKQFDNTRFRQNCSDLGIDHRFTSVAHPQSNGQAEVTNRTLLDGIKKRLGACKGRWAEELQHVLWSYRVTPRESTGESPFALAFGVEAVTPVELQIPTPRVVGFQPQQNDEALRGELDLIEERRTEASARVQIYQQRMRRAFNARVRPRHFTTGDLVLRKIAVSDPRAATGKLAPNWEGPYRVEKDLGRGAYILSSEGTVLPRSWNAEHLRMYYP